MLEPSSIRPVVSTQHRLVADRRQTLDDSIPRYHCVHAVKTLKDFKPPRRTSALQQMLIKGGGTNDNF